MSTYICVAATAITALIALGGVAQADIISGGPLYAGSPAEINGFVNCRLFNAGIYGVTVTNRQIWDNTGVSEGLFADSCGPVVAPGKYCSYTAKIAGNFAFSCRAVTNGVDNNVSGVIEIDNSAGQPLFVIPLHN
jgi:hypothetical protein